MGTGHCSLIRVGYEGRRFTPYSPPSSLWSVFVMSVVVSVGIVGSVPVGEKEVATLTSRSLYWSPFQLQSDTHHSKRSREVQPIQLCGYRLLEAVRGLCRGNYVGYTRRSDPDMTDERMVVLRMQGSPSTETAHYQLVPNEKEQASSSKESSHFRFRRNIIDECCKKPCSVIEMLKYCGRR